MKQDREVRQGSTSSPPAKLIQSVERAFGMLEEVGASTAPLSATEIANRAGVNRATAWRLLNTLEHFHFVERDRDSGKYLVGYGASRIAHGSGAPALIRRARPVLERLGAELEESVYLQVAAGNELIVLDEVAASRPIRVHLPNVVVPLHCGSVGKLHLAFLPEDEREEVLAGLLDVFSERTITDLAQLRDVIARARDDHFAWAYKEHLVEWGGATSVACDRGGRPLAYINVTVPAYRYTEDGLKALRAPLQEAATALERRLIPARDSNLHGPA